MPHVDDLDLLAVASDLREANDPALRHVAGCTWCQARQAQLMPPLANCVPPNQTAGNFGPIRSQLRNLRPAGPRIRRLIPMAFALVLLMVWPKLWWPFRSAPWGLTGLWVAASGHYTPLSRDKASSGQVSVRWGPQGWALLTAQHLPAPPPHDIYEVWWVLGRQRVRAAVLPQGKNSSLALWMYSPRHFHGLTGIGITLEPAPGGMRPTGPRQYFAALSPHL